MSTEKTEVKKKNIWYSQLTNKDTQKAVMQWWEKLKENKGACAQLRRSGNPSEAACSPEVFRLAAILPWLKPEILALIAGTLAHVRNNTEQHFAAALATSFEPGKKEPFSEIRMRQLLNSKTAEELYRLLRRAVKILKGSANPLSLTDGIILWSKKGDLTLTKGFQYEWAEAYYSKIISKGNKS